MKKAFALFILLVYASFSFACSTFLLSKNGHHVFGRNYDWVSGNGMVVVNARGVKKTSFAAPGSKTIEWVSECGSITFNQFGKEFPHGGMNEKGLVVELMWLAGTTYPDADSRAGMNELQWIQYQLDNCATVEEVIATDKKIRIDREGAVPLHYLVADAAGNAATIEFVRGKMVVHRGNDLKYPVLTNTIYSEALQKVEGRKEGTAAFSDNSVDRFATACRMVQQFNEVKTAQKPVDYAFDILDKIAQGDYTKWRIVYDITNRSIYYVTNNEQQRRTLSFTDFDFSCRKPALALNLSAPQAGAVATYFTPLNFATNKTVMEQSARESRSAVRIPAAQLQGAAAYFNNVTCRE